MMRSNGPSRALRAAALLLAGAFAAGCSGNGSRLIPASPSAAAPLAAAGDSRPAGRAAGPAALASAGKHRKRIAVRVGIRIPRRRHDHVRELHPSTISSLTQSVTISVDGGTANVFNTTPTSPGCSIGAAGTTCTFSLSAPIGTDSFVVTTYTNANAGGTALDHGVATVPIVAGKANAIAVTLGPVVTTTADSGMGSLRYAVGSANAGDTIMFLLPAGSTIALATPIALALAHLTLAGPGAANLAISGGNAHQIFQVTGIATVSGLTIEDGKAATANDPGGAINNGGSLTLASDVVGASTSIVASRIGRTRFHPSFLGRHPHCSTTYSEGGAVYNNGTLISTGTTYQNNIVQSSAASCIDAEGGAIFNDVSGSISSTGDTFSGNSALAGGAIYNLGIGTVTFTNDAFTGNTGCNANSGCPTSGCTAGGCTSYATGQGGAIFDGGGISVASSTFTSNVAGGQTPGSTGTGGAIAFAMGTPSVTGSTFTGNLAGGGTASCSGGMGGAIAANVNIDLESDTFNNNTAAGDQSSEGGAVLAITPTTNVTGKGDAFSGNQALGYGSACQSKANGIGGALYAAGSASFNGSTFTGNTASGNFEGAGGAFAGFTITLAGDTFTSNAATGTGAFGAAASAGGGALYLASVGKVNGCTFTSNSATIAGSAATDVYGGAVVVNGTLASGGNTYASNTVTAATGTPTAIGGALALITGTFTSNGDTFKSNVVTSSHVAAAGAAYLEGAYTVTGATISGNSASGAEAIGGGLATNGANSAVSNSALTGNVAVSSSSLGLGGGIFDTGGATYANDTISGNSATTGGGGLADGASVTEVVASSTVSGNTVTNAAIAQSGGGGIYAAGGIEMALSTVANNTVTVSGAGPAGGGGVLNGDGLLMIESTISGNSILGSAASGGGGGILNASGLAAADATISGNSSTLDAGGVWIASNDSVTFTNATLYKNHAAGIGGNIDNLYTISLTNSIVAGGTAGTGADIDNAGTVTSNDYNIIQTPVVGNAVSGTTTHDLAVDPQLLAVSNNGGPTFTNADQATSPGTAYIPFSGSMCGAVTLGVDQRGYARGAGGKCDVGAFEFGGIPSAIRTHLPAMPRMHAHAAHGLNLPHIHVRPADIRI